MSRPYPKKNAARGTFLKQSSIAFISLCIGYLSATLCDVNTVSGWFTQHVLATEKTPVKLAQNVEEPPKPKLEFYTLLTKEGEIIASSEVATTPTSVSDTKDSSLQQAVALGSSSSPKEQSITAEPHSPVLARQQLSTQSNLPESATAPQTEVKKPASMISPPEVATLEKPVTAIDPKSAFLVQVAAFKNRRDAEKMQAMLIMKGFDVSITSVTQPTGNWFRVIMGPFASRMAAEKAQTSMARSERIIGMIRRMNG